jgi:PAS domain S-box-containing protein
MRYFPAPTLCRFMSAPSSVPDPTAELAELHAALLQARAAAAGAQHQFTQLVNSLHEGMLLTDIEGRIALLNQPFCTLVGLAGPAATWIGQPMTELLTAAQPFMADPAGFTARTHEMRGQHQAIFNDPVYLRDGRVLERDYVPVPPTAGSADSHLLVRLRDVTARYQATAALQTLANVPEQNPNPVFRLGPVGEVLYINAAAIRLRTTVPAAELARARAEMQRLATAALAQNQPSRPILTLGEQYFEAAIAPFPAEGYVNIYLVDITPQQQAQAALASREKQYRDLLHYTQALICTHNLAGELLTVNPAVAELLGVPQQALPGRRLHDAVPPAHRAEVDAYLAEVTEQGQHQGVMAVQTSDGEQRYLLYQNYCVEEAGQAPYVVGYAQDITGRIEAEQVLKLAKKNAEAAVLARENFLANMSHEIRTPLNGVLGMAAQLGKTRLDGRQQEFVDIIRTSGQHLLSVINDVLDMAKISSGKLELEQTAFNLCDSMGRAIEPLVMQAREKGLHFSGRLLRETCPYPWVIGDPYRLNQILINLVANAIKFTPAGGSLRVVGEMVDETAAELHVRFSVTDTGIGIAADKQADIFEGFTQAYANTTRRFGGTGLGLSISKALVEQLGGTLTVESELGRGSTFSFELALPKAPPAAAVPVVPGAYDTGVLRGRRMLLFEDNEINRTLVRLLLEDWGVVLDEAASGPEGLALFAEHEYDAVLMDIQMPGMSGLEATAIIRALPDPRRAGVSILALTANAFRADNERYLAAGLDACLAKPYEEATLYQALARLVRPIAPAAYNLTRLHEQAHGRVVFVQKIIRSFLANIPGSLQELATAAAAADWTRVAAIVHHIKPSLEAVGVPGVAEAVARLERHQPAALSESGADALPLHEAAARLLAQVQHTLDELPRELRDVVE